MIKQFDYEWFNSLGDKELMDVAFMEAMRETISSPTQIRHLLAALGERLNSKMVADQARASSIMREMDETLDEVRKLQQEIRDREEKENG